METERFFLQPMKKPLVNQRKKYVIPGPNGARSSKRLLIKNAMEAAFKNNTYDFGTGPFLNKVAVRRGTAAKMRSGSAETIPKESRAANGSDSM